MSGVASDYKIGDKVVRLYNGRHTKHSGGIRGGDDGDDYGAFTNEIGTIIHIISNEMVRVTTNRRKDAVWLCINFSHISKLHKALE